MDESSTEFRNKKDKKIETVLFHLYEVSTTVKFIEKLWWGEVWVGKRGNWELCNRYSILVLQD